MRSSLTARRSIVELRLAPLVLAGALAAPLAAPATAQDLAEPGFALTGELPVPALFAAWATLADGRVLTFDGLAFELWDAGGGFLAKLGSLPAFVFPSFVVVDPGESFALVGESSNGDLFRVELAGGFRTVTRLAFNFDAAFDDEPGFAIVSAATGGFGTGNDLYRVDLSSGASARFAHLDGPSGPIAVGTLGELYYATQDVDFPPDPGSTDVLVFSEAQVEGGVVLGARDAELFCAGFDGGSSLVQDPLSRSLYLAENDVATGIGRIHEIAASGARRDLALVSTRWVASLQIHAGPGAASFQGYQPAGARMRLGSTDFAAGASAIRTLEPARATAAITGPGSGPGIVTLTVSGAEPNAGVVVGFGLAGDHVADELTYDLGLGFPFHTHLPLGKLRRLPLLAPTDSQGTATFSYFDPGSLHGTLVFLGVVAGPDGAPRGTSTAAFN